MRLKHNLRQFPPRIVFDYRKNYELKEHLRMIYEWKANLEMELEHLKQLGNEYLEAEGITTFSRDLENLSYFKGKICLPIDEVLGK